MGTTQKCTDARNEFARRERLDEVVVGAEFQSRNLVLEFAFGGEHDDRHIGCVANGFADLLTRHLRQHQVENHQVESVLAELVESDLAVFGLRDPVALALEVRRDGVANGLLILHQQDSARVRSHASPFRRAA